MRSGYLKNQRYTGLTQSPSGCSIVPSAASPVDASALLDVEEAEELFDAVELLELLFELQAVVLDELLSDVDSVEVVQDVEDEAPQIKGQTRNRSSQIWRNAIVDHETVGHDASPTYLWMVI